MRTPEQLKWVGLAVSRAVRESNLPEGVFSLLYGSKSTIGRQLVEHPLIKAGASRDHARAAPR